MRAKAKKLERLRSFVKFCLKRNGCDAFGDATPPGPGHREWTAEDVKDFIFLSVYTGLRISDVATFDISPRLKGNDVFLRMHKTKRELYTWIPGWLVDRLREREKYGALIFATGHPFLPLLVAQTAPV